MQALKDIQVLIWDFDKTFYKDIPELSLDIREAEYKTIMLHTGWDRDKTISEFNKIYPALFQSATKSVAELCGITTKTAAIESENYFDRTKYLKRDDQLTSLFTKLKDFRHLMLVNGIQEKTKESLKVLGLAPEQFEEIITSEVVGENKPSEKGFRYILEKTKLPPEQHLMIGDRELVDLVPAKKLGMHTCLVWSDKTESDVADVILPDVYAVRQLFA